jgi:hypothetical protein
LPSGMAVALLFLVMKKTSTILAIGSGLLFSQAQAEIESGFHVGYNSQYIFRGLDLGDDAYEYGLDLAGSCDCGLDWSAGLWSISPDNSDGNIDELDIYAAVSKDFGGAAVAVGFTAYTYDTSAPDDAEVFLSISSEFSGGFEGGVTAYFGTDGIFQQQILLEGSLGYTHEISDTITASVGLTYGYIADDGLGGYATSDGKAYFIASLGLDVALSDQITFSPYVSYVDAYAKNLAATSAGVEDGAVAGAMISFSF